MIARHLYHRFAVGAAPLIEVRDFYFSWRGIANLRAPSGSGKSTLFRLLCGWFGSQSGSICEFDPPLHLPKNVYYIGTHSSLLPWLTVERNILLQAGPSDDSAAIPEALSELSLDEGVADLLPYQLSTGMYKRIELLIGIKRSPVLLLLDEFFSSLDEPAKLVAKEYLRKFRPNALTWVSAHEPALGNWLSEATYTFQTSAIGTISDIIIE